MAPTALWDCSICRKRLYDDSQMNDCQWICAFDSNSFLIVILINNLLAQQEVASTLLDAPTKFVRASSSDVTKMHLKCACLCQYKTIELFIAYLLDDWFHFVHRTNVVLKACLSWMRTRRIRSNLIGLRAICSRRGYVIVYARVRHLSGLGYF